MNTGREMAVIRLGAPVLSVAVSNGDTHLCLTTRSFSGKGVMRLSLFLTTSLCYIYMTYRAAWRISRILRW